MAYRVGEDVGPYEVLQALGRGSFSIVLLGQDRRRSAQRVALKVVPCDHLDARDSARAKQEALAEADLLQRLRHPHIVTCHEVCWDEARNAVWLALDYMDGGDLQGLIDDNRRSGQQPMEAAFVRRVLFAVGGALVYIHSQGVLHRDVKPSNVLVTRASKEIRLADFGISKILEATHLAHTAVGTPFYLSPEIVQGEPYGPASDAWALGICLYELASLRRPFEASNQLALACCIVQQEPAELPASCGADVARVIVRLLNKDPLRRMQLDEVVQLAASSSASGGGAAPAISAIVAGVAPAAPSRTLEPELPLQANIEPTEVVPRSARSARCHEEDSPKAVVTKPRSAFGTPIREEVREQRKMFRRRWPSLRRGLRSTLARATSSATPVHKLVYNTIVVCSHSEDIGEMSSAAESD